jgi:hypothetical protein
VFKSVFIKIIESFYDYFLLFACISYFSFRLLVIEVPTLGGPPSFSFFISTSLVLLLSNLGPPIISSHLATLNNGRPSCAVVYVRLVSHFQSNCGITGFNYTFVFLFLFLIDILYRERGRHERRTHHLLRNIYIRICNI